MDVFLYKICQRESLLILLESYETKELKRVIAEQKNITKWSNGMILAWCDMVDKCSNGRERKEHYHGMVEEWKNGKHYKNSE